jgi:hypothetical protein
MPSIRIVRFRRHTVVLLSRWQMHTQAVVCDVLKPLWSHAPLTYLEYYSHSLDYT